LTQSAIDRLEAKHGRIDEIQPLSPLQEGLLSCSIRFTTGRLQTCTRSS